MAIEQAEFVVRTPEMTEFVHRWNRLPVDVRQALQRNRFGHVYQVVSRGVPAQRAAAPLALLALPVPPADAETTEYWERVMASLPLTEGSDLNSTIGQAPPLREMLAPVPRRRTRSLRRFLGLKK